MHVILFGILNTSSWILPLYILVHPRITFSGISLVPLSFLSMNGVRQQGLSKVQPAHVTLGLPSTPYPWCNSCIVSFIRNTKLSILPWLIVFVMFGLPVCDSAILFGQQFSPWIYSEVIMFFPLVIVKDLC